MSVKHLVGKGVMHLNYITELNNFFNWLKSNELPPDAQAFWHYLMHLNNGCAFKIDGQYYWPVYFKVANSKAAALLGFSRTQLDRMRNSLIQSGRIRYEKGYGSKAGKYSMVPFDTHIVTQYVTQTDTQVWCLCNNMCTLNNNNNIYGGGDIPARETSDIFGDELNEESLAFKVIQIFKKYFNRKPTEQDIEYVRNQVRKIRKDETGVDVYYSQEKFDLLEYAFGVAYGAGQLNWRYIHGVCTNLVARGIENVDGAIDYDISRK